MSRKYYDRLLAGSGTTEKKVKSKFGMDMLKKMGFEEGKGLGKADQGITVPIQVNRMDDGEGLGSVKVDPLNTFKWNDAFWDRVYNEAATNIKKVNEHENAGKKLVDESSEYSSDSEESFDGKIEIVKTSTPILAMRAESFKIKKDKKKDKKKKKDSSSSSGSSSESEDKDEKKAKKKAKKEAKKAEKAAKKGKKDKKDKKKDKKKK